MRTANPALSEETFLSEARIAHRSVMTVSGTAIKTLGLTILLVACGAVSWTLTQGGLETDGRMYRSLFVFGGMFGGLAIGLVTVFVPRIAPFTAPLYAALKGLFLGAISAYFNAAYQGIVIEAVALTTGILGVMAFFYSTGWIPVTNKFRTGVMAATGAVMLVYLASIVMRFFGVQFPFLHDTGPIGIGISLVIIVIASLNLLLDFDLIERGAKARAPKYMEWYGAFGLLVTLIWLYLEVLRLLAILRGRD
jgi:uncharacterized YccA/Bax inhibitor family protein